MKKLLLFCCLILLGLGVGPKLIGAMDQPHWYPTLWSGCTNCHRHGVFNYAESCSYCHTETPDLADPYVVPAPSVPTHSSDVMNSTTYGSWSIDCRGCHDEDKSSQIGRYAPLVQGRFSGYTENPPGGSDVLFVFTISSLTINDADWSNPSTWSAKTGPGRGLTLWVQQSTGTWYSLVIKDATATTITARGDSYYAPFNLSVPFQIHYGQLIERRPIPYGGASPVTVVFTGPRSFAANDGLAGDIDSDGFVDDSTPDGICQICHTETRYWRKDGTLSNHNNTQICTSCHAHEDGFKASCDSCHGNPPKIADTGGPDGLVGTPAPTGSTSAGAHTIHATPSGSNYVCSTCHFGGMPASAVSGNNKIQIGFDIFGSSGGGYDGRALNSPYTYEGTNGTAVTVGGTKTCSNIYCHSNGTSVATGTIQASISPSWDAAGPLACNMCHGFPPLYAQDQPKANSHSRHTFASCNVCHYATTTDGYTVTDFTRHKNANGVYDVVPDPNATYNGSPVSFSYTFDPSGGRCSNISCHGGNNANHIWGGVILTAGIGWTAGQECFEVQFTGHLNGTPPQTFNWDFGDGQIGAGETITHFYPQAGSYPVQLTATDANRRSGTASTTVMASKLNKLPVPDRTVTVSGYTVTVTDYSTDPDYNTCGHSGPGTVMVQWGPAGVPNTEVAADLTDVRPTVGRTISYTYTTAGTYTLKHAVKDNDPSTYVYSANTQVIVPSTYSVSGKVTRLDGTTPVSGASMRLKKGTGVVKITTTNVSGDYTFTNVLPDSYTVQAIKSGLTFPVEPPAVVINSNVTGVNISATR